MLGIIVFIICMAYSVYYYDTNTLVFMQQHATNLNQWFYWATIAFQVFGFVSLIAAIFSPSDKKEKFAKFFGDFIAASINNLLYSLLLYFGSGCMTKLVASKPTYFSELSPNLIFVTALSLSVGFIVSIYVNLFGVIKIRTRNI